MTFKEALDIKDKEGDTVILSGIKFNLIIVPELIEDRLKMPIYDEATYSDELAKKYSSNKQFSLNIMMSESDFNRLKP
jgi:hypothetical protein